MNDQWMLYIKLSICDIKNAKFEFTKFFTDMSELTTFQTLLFIYIHPSASLQKFVPIAQYLQEDMLWTQHSPQFGKKK